VQELITNGLIVDGASSYWCNRMASTCRCYLL